MGNVHVKEKEVASVSDDDGETTDSSSDFRNRVILQTNRDGTGISVWPDGSKYEGGITANKMNGWGTKVWSDGTKYEGNWIEDKMNGFGVKILPDGTKLEGNWIDNKMNGIGYKTWTDGRKYEGYFKNTKMNGHGVRIWPDGSRYEGEFRNNKRHGHGVKTWHDGSRYEGDFKNDKCNGIGIKTLSDGSKYEGSFKDNKRNGYGLYEWPDGSKYEGTFKDNLRHGHGISTDFDGNHRRCSYSVWKEDSEFLPKPDDFYVLLIGSTGKYESNNSHYIIVGKSLDTNFEQELENKLKVSNTEEIQDYLYGVGNDLTNLQNYFIPAINENWNFYVGKIITKEYATQRISEMFDDCISETKTFTIIYSGYSTLETERNKGGYWVFNDGELTFEEVLSIWKESKSYKEKELTRLVLIVDACFSGCWVETWKELSDMTLKSRVIIQSSTKPHEVAKYTKYGSTFLYYWIQRQQDPNLRLTLNQTPMLAPPLDIIRLSTKICLYNGTVF